MKNKFLRRVGAWWLKRRKRIKFLLFVNLLIWFWPLYLGQKTYETLLKPSNFACAGVKYERLDPLETLPQTVKDTLDYYSDLYGVDKNLVYKIVKCESNNNPDRLGDYQMNLLSRGLWQFQPATFVEFASKYKIKNADINDYRDQTIVAIQMIRDGYKGRWTCSK